MLGGLIGLEREMSHKEAGLRTNILIAVGSTLITIISIQFAGLHQTSDPTRIAAQIVSGIGFLGAGAIIQARFAIHGLTTAATIWTVSAIGMTVGFGMYSLAFFMTMVVVVVLTVFKYFANFLERQHKIYVYLIAIIDRAALIIEVRKVITELNIKYNSLKLTRSKDGYEMEIIFHTSDNKNRDFVEKVSQLQGVKEILNENL